MWEMSMVPDGSNPGRNSCGYNHFWWFKQTTSICTDASQKCKLYHPWCTSSKRELPFGSVECDVLSVAGETREGKKKRNAFSRENAVGNTRLRLPLIWCRRGTVRFGKETEKYLTIFQIELYTWTYVYIYISIDRLL